jgi:hypothetical protein
MRSLVLAPLAAIAFVATMTFDVPDANAVVYCKTVGVPKGCVVRPVAPVVTRPVVYCTSVGVPKGCVVRR